MRGETVRRQTIRLKERFEERGLRWYSQADIRFQTSDNQTSDNQTGSDGLKWFFTHR